MVSILIRNKNEARLLEKTLLGIRNQIGGPNCEVVLVDDHSTDDSVAIAQKYGCKVVELDKKFTYGYAINFGLKHCSNDIVLLLSAHNILLSNDLLQKLLAYFESPMVAGVRCTPVANTKQVEQSLSGPIVIDKNSYDHQKDWGNLLIANCSAVRKRVALQIPFNETIRSNEEKLWSLQVIENGYQLVSNIPCYYLYNKKNGTAAEMRDNISKFQIDGQSPLSAGRFLWLMVKLIPWSIRIAARKWWENVSGSYTLVMLKYRFKKGQYH